jgi:foldase protein PrsA
VEVTGDAPDSFDSAFVARILTRQIIFELVVQEVDERGLEVDDEALERARQDLEQQIPPDIIEEFPEEYLDLISEWNAAALVLQGDLVDAEGVDPQAAEQYFEDHPDEFRQVCASHILVETEQEASEIRAELRGGGDFAAIARDRSLDTGSAQQGGELPCAFASTYQEEFAEAAFSQEPGEIGEPVQTTFGWHVIRVNEFKTPAFEDVADEVQQQLANQANERFSEWLQEAVTDAEIDVNPRYGTWNEETGQVEPPGGPTTTGTEPLPPIEGPPEGTTPPTGPPPTG